MISDIAIVRFYRLFGKAKNIGYLIFSECTDRHAIHRFCVNSVMPYKTAENFSRRPVFIETSLKNGVCQKIGARFRYVPKRIRFSSSFLSIFCFYTSSDLRFSPYSVCIFCYTCLASVCQTQVQSPVQRFRNNQTLYLPIFPIAQSKKPQRSPLRLRFLLCTLGKISFVYSLVIYEPLY